ncbi:unnamed protein product [Rotaria sordida]|nr:unnamed protein product [Rotaria sordida]
MIINDDNIKAETKATLLIPHSTDWIDGVLTAYFSLTPQDFLYTAEQIIEHIADDYAQIILVHSYTVKSWSRELLGCISSLIGLICACCWWGREEAHHIKKIVSTDLTLYDHVSALIRIISYKPFHKCIDGQWPNVETILIDSIITFLRGAIDAEKLSCFIRLTTSLPDTLTSLVQTAPYDRIVLCAHGLLAEILTDEQLKELKIVRNIRRSCFDIIEQAWKDPSQKYQHIPLVHILRGFANLSKNDTVQANTAALNKMPLLIEILDKYPIVYDILWGLSFNSSIQEQLRLNHSFMTKLTEIKKNCSNETIRKAARGILWNLNSDRDKQIFTEKCDSTTFDIMISYSHKDKQICKHLYEQLIRTGYRVWIDFDQIHGNVMDAMVQAIEQSRTIIICMSEQYRRSNYCRAEAEYAFQRRLKIVPVLLQEHYKPDGWLLFLIGQSLYVDFTKHEFPIAIEMLIKEIKALHMQNFHNIEVQSNQSALLVLPPSVPCLQPLSGTELCPENVQNWTTAQVSDCCSIFCYQNRMKTITILCIIFLDLFNQRNTIVASEKSAEGTPNEQLESYDIKKKVIVIPGISNSIASYNAAIQINHILYLSGQTGIDPATRQLVSDDVQTCESCKMFFKRNAENQKETLKCLFDGQCEVNINICHVCSACRLEKCFQVGTRVEMIQCFRPSLKKKKPASSKLVPVISEKNEQSLKLPTLNLFDQDRSLLTTDQWALLSNLIHSYDKHNALVVAKDFAQSINNLHPRQRFKVNAIKVVEIVIILCQTTEPFIRSNHDFASLFHHDYSVVLRGAIENVSCLGVALIFRQSGLTEDSAFRNGMEITYDPIPYNLTLNMVSALNQDFNLVKLSLSIFAFCTKKYNTPEHAA